MIISGASPVAASVEEVLPDITYSSVKFTGVVAAIDGDQIVVDGQIITANPALIESAGFSVGDIIEVETITDNDEEVNSDDSNESEEDDDTNNHRDNDDTSDDNDTNDDDTNDDSA